MKLRWWTHSFSWCLRLLCGYNRKAEDLQQRPYSLQSLKYLLFDPWQKTLADPCFLKRTPQKWKARQEWRIVTHWSRLQSIVQSLSHVQLFATPWTAACQASLSFTISLSLLKLVSMELMIPSNHLPLPSSPLALNIDYVIWKQKEKNEWKWTGP